jgi:hypothetical protein
MRLLLILLLTIVSSIAASDEISKWVDDKGKVHYGNVPPGIDAEPVEKLLIRDTFDQEVYDEAKKRSIESQQAQDDIDRWRKAETSQKSKDEFKKKVYRDSFTDKPYLVIPSDNSNPRVPAEPWVISAPPPSSPDD